MVKCCPFSTNNSLYRFYTLISFYRYLISSLSELKFQRIIFFSLLLYRLPDHVTKVAATTYQRRVVTVCGVFVALLIQYCNVSTSFKLLSIEVLICVPLVFIFTKIMYENVDPHVVGGNQFLHVYDA